MGNNEWVNSEKQPQLAFGRLSCALDAAAGIGANKKSNSEILI